jgi:hypothetical protein
MIPYFSKKNRIKRFVKRYRDEIGIELYKAETSDWKGKADLVFHLNGVAYYRFARVENLPFARFEKLQEVLIAMESKLTSNELGNLLRAALGKIQDFRNGVKSALDESAWIISETLNRRDVLHVNGDLLLEMMAITIIRGDEKAGVIDSRIHDEKIKTFKANLSDLDFFLQSGISDLLPNLAEYSPQMVVKMLQENMVQQQKRNEITAKLLASVGNGKLSDSEKS